MVISNRRNFLKKVGITSIGLTGSAIFCDRPAIRPQQKPYNILFLVFDDLGPHLASYGDPNAQKFNLTPNFDRLAKMSLQFNRSYCQAAICGPSRACFLTGLRPDVTSVNTDHDYASKYRQDTTPLSIWGETNQDLSHLNIMAASGHGRTVRPTGKT